MYEISNLGPTIECFSINVNLSVSQIIVCISITSSAYESFRFLCFLPSPARDFDAVDLIRDQESGVSPVDGLRIIFRKIMLEVLGKWTI